jgi:hypothetical protein
MSERAGLVGFICPKDGAKRDFEFCFKTCDDHCEPLPLLLALADERVKVPGQYSTTEILNPPQAVYLQRHNTYYAAPEGLLWATFGTAWHGVMERGAERLEGIGMKDRFVVEKPFSHEIVTPYGKAIFTGKPDAYDSWLEILWDYKTVKAYFVKNLRAKGWGQTTYGQQINIYRVYGFPEAKQMRLKCLVKDHSAMVERKDGVQASVTIQVPATPDPLVRDLVKAKLGILLHNEDDPASVRPCSAHETWAGRRCADYCNASEHCPQFRGAK